MSHVKKRNDEFVTNLTIIINDAQHRKKALMSYANSEGPDEIMYPYNVF